VYEMLRCLNTRSQWTNGKKGRSPSLGGGGGGGGGLIFFFLINKNVGCEKTRKGKVLGV
jgi:hypothetical protein